MNLFWDLDVRGVNERDEIVEILEYKGSRFHKAQEWGPLVLVRFPDGVLSWVFADEVFIKPEDIDPEDECGPDHRCRDCGRCVDACVCPDRDEDVDTSP